MNFWTVADRKVDFIDFTPHTNTCFMLSVVYKTKVLMHFLKIFCFLCVWGDVQSLKCGFCELGIVSFYNTKSVKGILLFLEQ